MPDNEMKRVSDFDTKALEIAEMLARTDSHQGKVESDWVMARAHLIRQVYEVLVTPSQAGGQTRR